MPVYGLQFKAKINNVEKILASKSTPLTIRFSCLSCGELSRNPSKFSAEDQHEAGRSNFNLASRCQFCGRLRTVDVIPGPEQVYDKTDQGVYKTVIKLDCKGMEPVEFFPEGGWIVEAEESHEVFPNVDLSGKEWAKGDTKNQLPVGISSLEYRFIKE